MARKIVVVDDFDDTDAKEAELQDVQFIIGDQRYALRTKSTNVNKFKTTVKAWKAAAEKLQSQADKGEVEGQFVSEYSPDELDQVKAERDELRQEVNRLKAQLANGSKPTRRKSPESTGANASDTTKAINDLIQGKYWHKDVEGVDAVTVNDPVTKDFKGQKKFIIAMDVPNVPAGQGKPAGELVLAAFETAIERGIISDGEVS